MEKALAVFQGKSIRRTWFNDEWWFVAIDIVEALTNSKNPKGYLKDMRRRDEGFSEGWGQIATLLEINTSGGKQRLNCVSTKGALRLVQSIPSKKAEPFKKWLAKVGYERIKEIDNPELAQKRMKELYRQKGYSNEWIEKRVRGIAVRQELTDEWKNRGVDDTKGFAILTNEITKATFDKTVDEYKEHKGLKRQNLRDHMDDIELILTMLGETATTKITRVRDSHHMPELKEDAQDGGDIGGTARRKLEKKVGTSAVSKQNYLKTPEKIKELGINCQKGKEFK